MIIYKNVPGNLVSQQINMISTTANPIYLGTISHNLTTTPSDVNESLVYIASSFFSGITFPIVRLPSRIQFSVPTQYVYYEDMNQVWGRPLLLSRYREGTEVSG